MNAPLRKPQAVRAPAFDPATGEILDDPLSVAGRKQIAKREAVAIMWPPALSERRKAFKTWRRIAMQIVHHEGLSFRLMAIIPEYLHWKNATLWPTNCTLAWEGGQCLERTIKRDISLYRDAGLLIVEIGWRRSSSGKRLKTRTLRLAVPRDLDGIVTVPDDDFHGDTSGPYESDDGGHFHGDTSGPEDGDTSGPITFEDTFEKDRRA